MYLSPKINLLLLVSAIAQIFAIGISFNPVRAQSIKPAADGTNTQVTTNGNQIDIDGGTRAGTNLFHSFEKFGLNQNEIANFLSTGDIQNILGRITGGNPSAINGLIQVTGGNPNLFLVNPSGIFFGPNATLNVPADFTATTATNIGIGDNFFNAFGENNYSILTGSPNGFVFSNLQPGSIVNAGNLTVNSGSNLRLFGGTVASTGELSGGNITVTTVPGENLLRITPKGHLLSLEIPASVKSSNPSVASLPELLTGSGKSVNTGDVVANKVIAENATLSAENNLTLVESQLQTTGNLNLLAKDTVFVRDSVANPFVAIAGGNLYVQGNQSIDILALNHPQTPFQSGGNLSLVSDGNVSGDAHFASGGQFKISTLSGEPGNFVSLFDPIILSKGDVELGDYTGASLHILAGGSVKAGNIEITETGTADDTINPANPDSFIANLANVTLSDGNSVTIDGSNSPTLDIRAGVDWDASGGLPENENKIIPSVSPSPSPIPTPSFADNKTDASITVGDVKIKSQEDKGTVLLTNQFNPNQELEGGEIKTGLVDPGTNGSFIADSRTSVTTSAFPFTVRGEATIQSTGKQTILSLTSPSLTSKDRITLTANINSSQFKTSDEYNVAFVIDLSGSTITKDGSIDGTPITFGSDIGDLNNDGRSNTILDAEIAAFTALNNSIIASGVEDNTTVGIIPFAESATTTVVSPSGVEETLTSLRVENSGLGIRTNFNAAVGETIKFFNEEVPQNRNNLVFFVSDGKPSSNITNSSPTTEQINQLTNITNDNITALGILDTQASADSSIRQERLEALRTVDKDVNQNSLVDDPSSLTAGLTGEKINLDDIQKVEILVNGELTQTLPKEDLQVSESGLKFNSEITGLQSGDNTVEVQVVLNDGNNTTANTTQNIKVISSTESFTDKNPPLDAKILVREENKLPELQTPNQELPNNSISQLEVDTLVEEIEETSTEQFLEFAGDDNVEIKTVQDTQGLLGNIGQTTGVKPAAVYIRFLPEKYVPGSSLVRQDKNNDVLNIIIVTAEGQPIRKQIKGATRSEVRRVARTFMREVSRSRNATSTRYKAPAKQLYDWLIKPYEAEVQQLGIKNLMFVMDPGLRQLPVAALYDGKQFVIEKYSVGLLPSISLTDTRYVGLQNSKVLAMGSSTFTEDQNQNPLPAVSIELPTIAGELREGKYISGSDFTLENLKKERDNNPYGIIHLATHADFPSRRKGGRKESYIQLYDQKLRLEDVRQLGWNNPPVELLVLSACRSALGDLEAELGFAGLAVQTGVKSAVASLWFVSDAGTLGVMTEFYRQLSKAPIKAEALRQTQLAMLQGKVRVEGNQLIGTSGNVTLTPEQTDYLRNNITGELSHPYYWASFTMIGSPW